MFPPNVTGISCPGCQPNDFPVPHICGAGGTMYPSPIVPPSPPTPCEHCWCIEETGYQSRWVNGQFLSTNKPHDVCCTCGSRRVKVAVDG